MRMANFYTKTELRVLKEIMNRINKEEQIYLIKRNTNIFVSFAGICEIRACSELKFPYNIESVVFVKTEYDPIEKILNEKRSNELDVYFSTPDKSGICKILPNAAGIEKIGISQKETAFLGKNCKFKLFATEERLFFNVYNEINECIGIFCPCQLAYGEDLKPEIEKMFKFSEVEKTA